MPQLNMSTRQQGRYVQRVAATLRISDPLAPRLISRVHVPGIAGTGFPYDLVVAGEVNRAEWAEVIRELLRTLTKGKKATLARLLGVDPKTIDLWLGCKVKVSEASVRQVADKTGGRAMDLLIRVGYYARSEMPERTPDEVIDDEIQIVLDSDLDEETQAAYIEELERLRAEDRELHEQLARRDKERRIKQLRERIQQAQRTN